jgi:hypothetical protein
MNRLLSASIVALIFTFCVIGSAQPAQPRAPVTLLIVGQKTNSPRTSDTPEIAHHEKLETVAERVRLREMEDAYFARKASNLAQRLTAYAQGAHTPVKLLFASTGAEFLSVLTLASRRERIARIVVFGHSGPDGLYMLEDRGLYQTTKEIARDSPVVDGPAPEREARLKALGARDLGDLQELLKSGEVQLANDAVIIFTGCSVAGTTEVSPHSFAASMAEATGATVYGSVNVTDDTLAPAANLWQQEYSIGTWVRFRRQHRFEDLNSKTLDVLKVFAADRAGGRGVGESK